jgi:hypothetical protein
LKLGRAGGRAEPGCDGGHGAQYRRGDGAPGAGEPDSDGLHRQTSFPALLYIIFFGFTSFLLETFRKIIRKLFAKTLDSRLAVVLHYNAVFISHTR